MKKGVLLSVIILFCAQISVAQRNNGEFNNLVVFVRFANEAEDVFTHDMDFYNRLYNDSSSVMANSVFNYFWQSSYNKLRLKTTFVPYFLTTTTLVSIQSQYIRNYFRPYNSITNKDGYTSVDINLRESRLVKEISQKIEALLPEAYQIPSRTQAAIDNITFVLSGEALSNNGQILWPHQTMQIFNPIAIKGKNVGNYVFLFDKAIDTGVICHETTHALGAPDLYVSKTSKTKINPMGDWDLMATNRANAQGMSAYTKHRYGGWLEAPEKITTPGYYRLYPVNGADPSQVYYKIQESTKDEYFVVEYRKKEGAFDTNIWSSGLLVYRINESVKGNNDSDGITKPYGQYLFRNGGSFDKPGELSYAALSAETGRTRFAAGANIYPFYSDGTKAAFEIKEVGECKDYIEFYFNPDYYASEEINAFDNFSYRIENNTLYARSSAIALQKVVVVNMQGITVCETMAQDGYIELNISELLPAIYLLKFTDISGNEHTVKIYR